jgi:two-component system NtrC family response regulator
VERLGGRGSLAVDARVVTATNAELSRLLAEGRFREDLYYRIGVVTIPLPPLRDREDDVVLIANALLRGFAAEAGRKIAGFSGATVAMRPRLPGNARELENRESRGGHGGAPPRRPSWSGPNLGLRQGLRELRAGLERETIRAALKRNRGNISQTAAELGISRPTLYGLLAKFNIDRP